MKTTQTTTTMETKRRNLCILYLFPLLLFLKITTLCTSLPLSTSSRYIVDESGKRVKLACVNWASTLDPMLPEGIHKKPIEVLAGKIIEAGFNCVRLTWSTFMYTRSDYSTLTVYQTLNKFQLTEAIEGITRNNPNLLDKSVVEVHRALVDELGNKGAMVVLDNHVSFPKWCCGWDDGNGFFGDQFFDPNEWIQGLVTVARAYKDHPAVIGMSLRNELRGNRQNTKDWYRFMAEGAKAVHTESPRFLVIISGLSYDSELGFLNSRPLSVGNLDNKLVYEAHWYAFGTSLDEWTSQTNTRCSKVIDSFMTKVFFVTQDNGGGAFPLFLSEFGIDQRGTNEVENRYVNCLLATIATFDIDWALWAFQGSYILREGVANMEEFYGVMDVNWDGFRNPEFLSRLEILRHVNQDPVATGPIRSKLFHPTSRRCVVVKGENVVLDDCEIATLWATQIVNARIAISLPGTSLSLTMNGDGAKVVVSSESKSMWMHASASRLHLATDDARGGYLCLDRGPASEIVTRKCLCMDDQLSDYSSCSDNPQVQWFSFVSIDVGTH